MTSDRLIAGRYRLGDPIGTGAMGVVWRASDVRLRRTVAVKQLLLAPGLTRSQAVEAKMRAMREGRIAARLHHPNAVTVFDVAEEDGQPWLVMEFVDAPSLAALMREQGPMDPQQVARIGAKVAAALAAAHDAGIVHRDVKPANILVADNGTVKITDFGISRAVGDVTVTSTGFLAGTPAYLSPEIARGENPEPSSDVFALGSTLYAAVEGKPPFGEGDNPLAVLHSVARAQVPEPKRAGALGPVLMALLAAEPGDRPSMRKAQEELEAVAEGRAPTIVPAATKVLPVPTAAVDAAAATTVLSSPQGTAALGNADAPTVHVATGGDGGGTTPAVPQANWGAPAQRRRVVAFGAAGAAVLVVVIGIVAVLLIGNRGDGGAPPNAGPPVPAASSSAEPPAAAPVQGTTASPANPTTTTPPSSSAAPSSTPAATPSAPSTPPQPSTTTPPPASTSFGPPRPADISGFIYSYYGNLPGNTGAAWNMLSPGYQAQTGGYQSYSSWWATIASVRVGGVQTTGTGVANATLTYRKKDGTVTSENRWFRIDSENGRMVITASGA
ncbi:serine/threonine protein kinase [Nocardia sp. CDC159]|uniref:non-specific serine/threonine protein kinase n=1 Tax=Nocardia pulmonis TaxID=2951408 RepID=A0A9X2E9W2_9NOCA|nr:MULTISPECIES: serine/threonine-protein kinase [Nocardia]MCM6775533.1 serine/threonine protein kinase [Nocardia pulmonis]MCM6787733.1 serine/threonine protein kinase [Nocardia sp. CDC159]